MQNINISQLTQLAIIQLLLNMNECAFVVMHRSKHWKVIVCDEAPVLYVVCNNGFFHLYPAQGQQWLLPHPIYAGTGAEEQPLVGIS